MQTKECQTHWAKIYIAGPIKEIEQVCREFVLTGLCVTVTPTNYIYSGGEQSGAEIGLINYPRFESTPNEINRTAVDLANKIMLECHQLSFTIMTPQKTKYFSRHDKLGLK